MTIIDARTRFPIDQHVTFSSPKAEDALYLLVNAILPRGAKAWGGIPKAIVCDNASIFANSKLFRSACEALGILLAPIKPHCPEANGKIERLFGTIKRDLHDAWPIWGKKNLHTRSQRVSHLSREEVREYVGSALTDYCLRRHSATNRKPLEHMLEHIYANPIEVDPELVRREVLVSDTRKLSKFGVRVHNQYYISDSFPPRSRESVRVQWEPTDQDSQPKYVDVVFRDDLVVRAEPISDIQCQVLRSKFYEKVVQTTGNATSLIKHAYSLASKVGATHPDPCHENFKKLKQGVRKKSKAANATIKCSAKLKKNTKPLKEDK